MRACAPGTSLHHEQASLPYNVLPACSAWKVDSSMEGGAGGMRYWREAFDAVDADADGYQHARAGGISGAFGMRHRNVSVDTPLTRTCAWRAPVLSAKALTTRAPPGPCF